MTRGHGDSDVTGGTALPQSRERVLDVLRRSWSSRSSSLWSPENVARGQCNVTALVIQDVLGGQILKTTVGGDWHFYNRIGDEVVDFTAEQFSVQPEYRDLSATREEAMAGATAAQYQSLREAFELQAKVSPAVSRDS